MAVQVPAGSLCWCASRLMVQLYLWQTQVVGTGAGCCLDKTFRALLLPCPLCPAAGLAGALHERCMQRLTVFPAPLLPTISVSGL
jgi:hypothetical protein